MKTGDCVVWQGGWHSIIEWLFVQGIKIVAGSPTHISTVIEDDNKIFLWESMAWGQCLHLFDSRLATANNEHWKYFQYYPLYPDQRECLDEGALKDYCFRSLGRKYNIVGAIRSGFRVPQAANDNKLFCSASHVFALQAGGLYKDVNPNAFTPRDVVRLLQ